MDINVPAKIQKMLYHLTDENPAAAAKELKSILNHKVNEVFNREYEQVKRQYSQENK